MRGKEHICRIDPRHPDPAAIARAAEIIRSGGVVVFPTRLLYGLGADARNRRAVDRIFQIKGRAADKPVLILINKTADLTELVETIPPAADAIIRHLWPGGVTLVFSASKILPDNLTAGTGKIGIRLPRHPVAASLLAQVASPVTATSANLSGQPGAARIDELPDALLAKVDLVLDAGPLPGGAGSTVVDVTATPPEILREGAVSAARIRQAVEMNSY